MKIDFEKVLKENGLKVGDKVILNNICGVQYIIINKDNSYYLQEEGYKDYDALIPISSLFSCEWEKVEPKKKFGDLTCDDIAGGYINCPLQCLICQGCSKDKVSERWAFTIKKYPQLEPMREWVEKELDKEVKE